MKRAVFYIKDKQLYHIGGSSGIKEYFPSDKLFSALVNFVSIMYEKDEFENILKKLKYSEISSMFFGIEILNLKNRKSKKIFFNQKPLYKTGNRQTTDRDLTILKKVKKINYISDDILNKLLNSFDKDEDKFIYDINENIIIQDKFALSENDISHININKDKFESIKIIKRISSTNMVENRFTGTSLDVFYNDFIEVNYAYLDNFLIKPFMYFNINNYFQEMKGLFNLMCDEGIGGHRSKGAGMFETFQVIDAGFEFPREGNYYMTISSVFPQKDEIDSIKSYALDDRNGFVYSNGSTGIKKPYYRIIKEGSIFEKNKVKGKILEILIYGLEHKVYLNGKAFLIGFGGKEI
ncbi:type III-A CRISPR-associated RAMP protein Csm4 [Clostridium sp.]|uniref:type III-A CRISPR-associated RAMP protein Csm4 n=1 Tax=Clostridium sp. TaxID=1506 RepID=UPI002FDE395F